MANKKEMAKRCRQIRELIENNKFTKALELIDDTPFDEVEDISDLYLFADMYEKAERIDKKKYLFNMVYERTAKRHHLYKLIELLISLGDLSEAEDLYLEYEIGPTTLDTYELRYMLAKAKGESIESLISILEDLQKEEFTEEWGYQLAQLYEMHGEYDKCVSVCDDLQLWFSDGKIVEKAMELKREVLHSPSKKSKKTAENVETAEAEKKPANVMEPKEISQVNDTQEVKQELESLKEEKPVEKKETDLETLLEEKLAKEKAPEVEPLKEEVLEPESLQEPEQTEQLEANQDDFSPKRTSLIDRLLGRKSKKAQADSDADIAKETDKAENTEGIAKEKDKVEPTEDIAKEKDKVEPTEDIAKEKDKVEPTEDIAKENDKVEPAEDIAKEKDKVEPTEDITQPNEKEEKVEGAQDKAFANEETEALDEPVSAPYVSNQTDATKEQVKKIIESVTAQEKVAKEKFSKELAKSKRNKGRNQRQTEEEIVKKIEENNLEEALVEKALGNRHNLEDVGSVIGADKSQAEYYETAEVSKVFKTPKDMTPVQQVIKSKPGTPMFPEGEDDPDDISDKGIHYKTIKSVMRSIKKDNSCAHFVFAGAEGKIAVTLAKRITKELGHIGYYGGRTIVKIEADKLNNLELREQREKLSGGCMLVTSAADLSEKSVRDICAMIEAVGDEVVVMLSGPFDEMDCFLSIYKDLDDLISYKIKL